MSFTREKIKDFYLLATEVENIFLNEYMPAAPGDYVKVYLYGLLYSQNNGEMTREQMAKQLGMAEKQIDAAWEYWNQMGVVDKNPKSPAGFDYDIEFKQLRGLMYASQQHSGNQSYIDEKATVSQEVLYDEKLKNLVLGVEEILGKDLSAKETQEIFCWIKEIGATFDVISAAVSYCIEKGKTGISYMTKVIQQWTEDGLKTEEDVKIHIEAMEYRFTQYNQILRTLGLNRGVTRAEKEIIDRWFDEMNFNMDRVLDACCKGSFISSPNVRYVNGILEKWYEEAKNQGRDVNSKKTITQSDLNRYYEHLRKSAEERARNRKEEVYEKLPRIEQVDKELILLGKRLSKSLLSGDSVSQKDTKRLMSLLEQERAVLLTENNFREDYTDIKYSCNKCNDTGITDEGIRCSCTKEKIGEAEIWLNSSLAKK